MGDVGFELGPQGWVGWEAGRCEEGPRWPGITQYGGLWMERARVAGEEHLRDLPCGFCISWRWRQADSSVSDVLFGLVGASSLLCLPRSLLPAPEASLDCGFYGRDEGGSCHAAAFP